MKNDLILTEEPMNNEATKLIAQAIDKNVPVETMEKLLAMRRELKAEKAKELFDQAMASFQANCPTIIKTKEVKTKSGIVAYRYAPIESIVDQVKESLKNNGFSYSTDMELLESGVKVCVKVTHSAGHSEVTCMSVPLGNKTEIMSQSQVVAAAQTFAKRYAFCNAFGILTGDEDNDGDTNSLKLVTKPEVKQEVSEEPKEKKIVSRPITATQKTQLLVVLGQKGKNILDLTSFIEKKFKKDSYKDLTDVEADFVIKKLEGLESKTQLSEPI